VGLLPPSVCIFPLQKNSHRKKIMMGLRSPENCFMVVYIFLSLYMGIFTNGPLSITDVRFSSEQLEGLVQCNARAVPEGLVPATNLRFSSA
jgi:hypothetical protein